MYCIVLSNTIYVMHSPLVCGISRRLMKTMDIYYILLTFFPFTAVFVRTVVTICTTRMHCADEMKSAKCCK